MLTESGVSRIPAWYAAPIAAFLRSRAEEVLGRLTKGSHFDVDLAQRDAWQREIAVLLETLVGIDGWLFLEFDVPRLGSRIDAVVVTARVVIPIEFKVGSREFARADYDQA